MINLDDFYGPSWVAEPNPSPTITFEGDVIGSGVIQNLEDTTILTEVVNNSHNHTVSDITGLEEELSVSASVDVSKPSITSPTLGQTDFSNPITSSAYDTPDTYRGIHDKSHWQIAQNELFGTLVAEYSGSSNLVSWSPVGLPTTILYVRVRHGSDKHLSDWSDPINFSVSGAVYIDTPVVAVTGSPSSVIETPTISTSAFSVTGGSDTHASTSWLVKQGSTIVWSSLNDAANKLSITVPSGTLLESITYTFQAIHNGTAHGSSATGSVDGTTLSSFDAGGLWLWGYNNNGQLGNSSIISRSSPVQTICGGTNWGQIACGADHTAAIKTDGTLWLWGYNSVGKLGNNTTADRSSPVQTISGGTNWSQVSCGADHTAAIKTDGSLWVWGRNIGNLGDGTFLYRSSPVQTICGGTNWSEVACGAEYTAAIKTDGSLWLWGSNGDGRLGHNTIVSESSPVQTVSGGNNWSQVGCGDNHTAAIKTDGTLWCWGYNQHGQTGDNTDINRSSPVQTISGGTNWSQVACGSNHTAAVKTDGTLWLWGNNDYGQLGNNIGGTSYDYRSSPVQTVSGGNNWKQVICGGYNTAAIKTDGTLWLWGSNSSGKLGNNSIINRSSPVQTVSGGTNWNQVACGRHTAAIRI